MKKTLSLLSVLSIAGALSVHAEETRKDYPSIYPFVATPTSEIDAKMQNIVESSNYVKNIFEINSSGLTAGKTKEQPWTSTYWPLNKGLIADPYTPNVNVARLGKEIMWQRNFAAYNKRVDKVHAKINELSEKDLETLAPSEKYDLLLGDYTFDLTNRMWKYASTYGEKNKYGFLLNADMDALYDSEGNTPDDFNFEKKGTNMALWEGICHGWSPAAGHVPRPKKSFSIKLENGKNLKFYPDDIKALASLMWANSDAQFTKGETADGKLTGSMIFEGLRCNLGQPKRDQWGRFYDSKPDPFTKKFEPRCVGVHPAVWHMTLVNIIGAQGRSFVVERKIKAAVDNHPMAAYKSEYFNPETGKYGTFDASMVSLKDYAKDPFKDFRNHNAQMLVGVKLTMTYVDWERPQRKEMDSPLEDKLHDVEMMYDLEIDKNGNIIGGQWRVNEKGNVFLGSANVFASNNQPDFIWIVSKRTGQFFQPTETLSPWLETNKAPPADWRQTAFQSHFKTNIYSRDFKNDPLTCRMVHKKKKSIEKEINCTYRYNQPQPLIDVVMKLVDLARE